MDKWDRLRHVLYKVSIILICYAQKHKPENKVLYRTITDESLSLLVGHVFIVGMLIPSIIDDICNDRMFHWYDMCFILFSLFGGMRKIIPYYHKDVMLKIISEARYNKWFS